jgi:transposase
MRAALLTQVRAYDRLLRRLARSDEVCRRLMTAPGVGVQTAFAYRAGIDRPERLRRSGSVPPALGLSPKIDQSGERERRGAITKAANALATRTRSWCALKRWGMNRARVAVARKLAIILHRMWCDVSEFRWSEHQTKAA